MENPEEVLQALDEFQKLRPSEIPRELEEYLCWVAKTGDPVYQWSLIKALFREKLMRVMTEFYESCPSIDGLASCPNVEHFNYDSMKSSLLERLESFANAPFTVQRICELLTTPRKEYNRVDKFMRAIEKNILVVSTREPGPTTRRSENRDGLVNGSVEDEIASGTQPADEIEMESWVKDCTPNTGVPVHGSAETEGSQLPSNEVSQSAYVVKQLSPLNGSSQDKLDHQSAETETSSTSTFAASSSDFLENATSDSNTIAQEQPVVSIVQNSTVVHETSSSSSSSSGNSSNNSIVGDVPEAIMNEDTSSQPSLDLEGEDGETNDSSRKLQTTFQAKDFITNEGPKASSYVKDRESEEQDEEEEKPVEISKVIENHVISEEVSSNTENSETVIAESSDNFLQTSIRTEVETPETSLENSEESKNFALITDNPNEDKPLEESTLITTENVESQETNADHKEPHSESLSDMCQEVENSMAKTIVTQLSPDEYPKEPKIPENNESTTVVQETLKEIPNVESIKQLPVTEEFRKVWKRSESVIETSGIISTKTLDNAVSAESEEPPAKVILLENSSLCTLENGQDKKRETKNDDETMEVDSDSTTPVAERSEPMEQETTHSVDSS